MLVEKLDQREAQQPLKPREVTSELTGPIERLGFLQKALLFGELSKISYQARAEAGELANLIGFPEIRFYDRDGAQAYMFANETDAVIACRGTEPNEWNDIRADLDAATALAESVGRVHRGFKREVDDLWPRLEQALVTNEKTLWFTGHSLGGAMAAICAGRCKLSEIRSNPRAVFTFGSPRIGNKRYVNYARIEYYRFENNNDIVPRVPPLWLGYRHGGKQVYIDRYGRISTLGGWLRMRDRFHGFIRGLTQWRIDHFTDHLMAEYLQALHKSIEQENTDRMRRVLNKILKSDPPQPLPPPAVAKFVDQK